MKREIYYPNFETYTAYWIKKNELTIPAYHNLKAKMSTFDMKEEQVTVAFFDIMRAGSPDYVVVPKLRKKLLDFIVGRQLPFEKVTTEEYDIISDYESPKFTPKPFQKDIIDGIERLWKNPNSPDTRAVIALGPGTGKTFCSASLVSRMKCKFIFLVYSAKLIEQTYKTFCHHLGSKGMLMLGGKSPLKFEDVRWENVRGVFMTHRMIHNLMKTYDVDYISQVLEHRMGAVMCIYDEFDKEVKNLYRLDCFMNFKYNLRLTGTPYKSLKHDDAVFKNIYKHAPVFGADYTPPSNKKMLLVHWKFNPSPKEYTKMQAYDEKLFKTYYNDYLGRKDIFLDYVMYQFWMKDDSLLKKCLVEEGGQALIYAGRIENCEYIKKKLIDRYDINEDDIGIYNSEITGKAKVDAESKRWIITTCSSLGRGYDNDNIRALIYMEFSFSASEAEQTWNRTARLGTTHTGYVIYGLDHSFRKCEMNFRKKINDGLIKRHFNEVQTFSIPKNWEEHYIHGYRKDSPEAKEIIEQKKEKIRKMSLSKRI